MKNLWYALSEARAERDALQKKISWIEAAIHHMSELAKLQAVKPDFDKSDGRPDPLSVSGPGQ